MKCGVFYIAFATAIFTRVKELITRFRTNVEATTPISHIVFVLSVGASIGRLGLFSKYYLHVVLRDIYIRYKFDILYRLWVKHNIQLKFLLFDFLECEHITLSCFLLKNTKFNSLLLATWLNCVAILRVPSSGIMCFVKFHTVHLNATKGIVKTKLRPSLLGTKRVGREFDKCKLLVLHICNWAEFVAKINGFVMFATITTWYCDKRTTFSLNNSIQLSYS